MKMRDYVNETANLLIMQGGPSFKMDPTILPTVWTDISCAYRSPVPGGKTRMCAAGLWIKDEDVTPAVEGLCANHENVKDLLPGPEDAGDYKGVFWRTVQTYLHDHIVESIWTSTTHLSVIGEEERLKMFNDRLAKEWSKHVDNGRRFLLYLIGAGFFEGNQGGITPWSEEKVFFPGLSL